MEAAPGTSHRRPEEHDDMAQYKENWWADVGRSDTGMLVTGLVELVVQQEIHFVREARFDDASEAVHYEIAALEVTWILHSRFRHLVAPLRLAIRA